MPRTTTTHDDAAQLTDTYEEVDYSLLVPAEDNVRDDLTDVADLAASIYQIGLQQPLRVVLVPIDEYGTHAYKIVAGHRRHAALGLLIEDNRWVGKVPVLVAPQLDDQERVAAMIVENIQRKDLNPVEEAHAFRRLVKEFGYKQADVAAKVGRSASYVSDRLALLNLPDTAVARVREGSLPLATAAKLTTLKDKAAIEKLIAKGAVPSDAAIEQKVNQLKAAALKAKFIDELAARKVELHESYFSGYGKKVVAEITDPKELGQLGKVPKNAQAWMQVRDWEGSVKVTIAVEMTEAEKAAAEAQRKAEFDAQNAERTKASQERYEKERAGWSDEYRAWVDECDRLRAEHKQAVAEHTEEQASIRRAWYDSLKPATVAVWAMQAVADMAYPPEAIHLFDVPRSPEQTMEEAITEWVAADNKNLAKLAAFVMLDQLEDESRAAVEAYTTYVGKHGRPAPQLELPPEPGVAGDDDTDDEIDPLDDVA